MFSKLAIPLQRLKLPFQYKIALAFLLILLSFAINAFISIILLNNINQSQERLKVNAVYLERLQSFKLGYTAEIEQLSDAIFINKVPINFFRHDFRDNLVNTLVKPVGQTSRQERDSFEREFGLLYYGTIVDNQSQLERYVKLGDFDNARQYWQKFNPDFEKATNLITTRQKQLETERAQLEREVSSTILTSTLVIVGVTILSILLSLFLLMLSEHVLVRPLNKLNSALHQVSLGNLDQSLELENRDEVGKLATSFAAAVSALKQVLKGTQIGEQLKVLTEELASTSQQQAVGAGGQVSSLSEVIQAMSELGQTAYEIDQRAAQVSGFIEQTTTQIQVVAEAGSASQERTDEMALMVNRTMDGVLEVGKQVKTLSEAIHDLNQQAETISRVVYLLGSVSKEIHLLALNASIEAASSGEYGDRFKVVAREMKTLSVQANLATDEAANLINTVQVSANLVLDEVEKSHLKIEEVISDNTAISDGLDELRGSAHNVTQAVAELMQLAGAVSGQAGEIKFATRQQQLASDQIIKLVHSAGSIAEQTSESARRVSSNCIALAGVTNQLNTVLRQVQLVS
jgi:methyl-accepting chemotaxis protein